MKRIIITIIILFSVLVLSANTLHKIDSNKIFIRVNEINQDILLELSEYGELLDYKEEFINQIDENFKKNNSINVSWVVLGLSDVKDINTINSLNAVNFTSFFIKGIDEKSYGITGLLYAKIKDFENINISNLEKKYGFKVVDVIGYEKKTLKILIDKNTVFKVSKLISILEETSLFQFVEDALLYNMELHCTNDEFFTYQWGHKNTGQSSGTIGMDINFCQANNITPGSYNRDIVRAVKSLATTLSVSYSEIYDFFENATFIPTMSALDINTNDLFYDLSSVPEIETFSPFDDVFYQTQNYKFGDFGPLSNALTFINSNVILANNYSDCDEDIINVSFNVSSNQYKESHSKISTQIVAEMFNNSESDFKSEGAVIMKPGFHSKIGSDFLARIKTCEIQLCDPPILYKKENIGVNKAVYTKADEVNRVSIYPNPTNGKITVSSEIEILKIEILNSIGVIMKTINDKGYKTQIDVSEFSKGTYFVSLYMTDNIIIKKLIKL